MLNEIHFGDCRESLRAMVSAGVVVQTCITSPPYFGLRDYGHDGQIGLEETPEQFIAQLVEVFRCVRDVLADNGTLWVNMGDSYSDVGRSHQKRAKDASGVVRPAVLKKCERCGTEFEGGLSRRFCSSFCGGSDNSKRAKRDGGLKQKDLIGIPWMLAFALRADGWYLRQDIIWNKPNPMPESVTDRCTKAHEYVFLLSKSPRSFYDSEAVKEPSVYADCRRPSKVKGDFKAKGEPLPGQLPFRAITETRNRRSVWTIATKPYKGAHFAVFPSALVEPCILAGSRSGDIVLDPFMGSGTTAAVAIAHGRQFIGCELNPGYKSLQDERISIAQSKFKSANAQSKFLLEPV